MSASRFFLAQFYAGRVPSETVQRQALAYAERSGDTSLMTAMVSRAGLAPDVESALASRDELDVLRAWAMRPGRSSAELVARFSSEKRATLLGNLAALQGLPDEVYRQVAKSTAVTLRWALLENPSVPVDLKVELASDLGARYHTTNSSVYSKATTIREMPFEVSSAFVVATSNTYFLQRLVRENCKRELLEVVVRRCGVLSESVSDAFDVAATAVSIDASGELVDLAYKELLSRFDADSDLEKPYSATRLDSELVLARQRIAFDTDEALARIGAARTPAEIASQIDSFRLAARNLGIRFSHEDIAQQVLSNTNADATLVNSYLMWADHSQGRPILERAIARKDRELAVLIMTRFASYGVDFFSEMYSKSDDPEEFLLWAIGDAKSAPGFVVNAAVVGRDMDLAFRLLPIASTLGASHYADEAEKLVVDALGGDSALWSTFSTLAGEWEGSLTDLLATVVSFGSN